VLKYCVICRGANQYEGAENVNNKLWFN